jgi:uncharacterized protein (DUF302 family)
MPLRCIGLEFAIVRRVTAESATTTYYIPESFDGAVRTVRRVLSEAGLEVGNELDMAGRLQRRLQVHTQGCKVLFVSAGASRWKDAGGAAKQPLHVVVSERGDHSEIHILRVPYGDDAEGLQAALGRLRAQIADAIERIAMRVLPGV